ncbi:translation initiation factor IF-2-like [Sceloporus undulatus]|uniref:translation initiation factor IF-2-like n=1 Tax=Sceloporus undulatus TaxID=8520 RepID=UPI001C4ACA34|nr:translation initiation factor IF-2-like [Sceloporus undulatus]
MDGWMEERKEGRKEGSKEGGREEGAVEGGGTRSEPPCCLFAGGGDARGGGLRAAPRLASPGQRGAQRQRAALRGGGGGGEQGRHSGGELSPQPAPEKPIHRQGPGSQAGSVSAPLREGSPWPLSSTAPQAPGASPWAPPRGRQARRGQPFGWRAAQAQAGREKEGEEGRQRRKKGSEGKVGIQCSSAEVRCSSRTAEGPHDPTPAKRLTVTIGKLHSPVLY